MNTSSVVLIGAAILLAVIAAFGAVSFFSRSEISLRAELERSGWVVRWDRSAVSSGVFIDGTAPEIEMLVVHPDTDQPVRVSIHAMTDETRLQAALAVYPTASVESVVGRLLPTGGIATGSAFAFCTGPYLVVLEPGVTWPETPSVTLIQLVQDLEHIISARR